MDRKRARILALAWLYDTSDNLLGWDAPWRTDYSPADVVKLERALEYFYDLLKRKLDKLEGKHYARSC